ncbi:MAG: TolC family protein [Treponema sp.]|jgi:outer membrane protein TolC|nr:TolC family protein [Treponema sp.]
MSKKRYAGGLKIPFCLVIFLLLCANLQAQETDAQASAQSQAQNTLLTPDEAVKTAVKNNLSLESSRAGTAVKKRASDFSWNQFIPNITLGGSLIRDNKQGTTSITRPIPGTGAPFSYEGINGLAGPQFFVSDPIDTPQWHIAGTIQASLNINLAMFENMKRLRLDYEGGLISYEKARAQLERDVRKAYHNMLLLQENIALLRGSFENAGRQVQMAQANYDAGLAPELTLLQAQVARENLRPIIDQAENGLKLSMAQFAMFLGLDYNTPFELQPVAENMDFIPIDVAQMIQKASSAKPDIQELRHTILLLQSARKTQFYSLTPSLSLSWNNNSVFIKDPWKDSWFGNSDDWNNSGSLTISLGVRLHSLIPFSADFQAVKNLDDQITTATIGLTQMIRGTEIEIYNTVLALEKTRVSAEAQTQTVKLAEQSFRLTEQAYQAGLQDYFQVQNAEQSLRQARVQMLEQQFNYLNGLIDLEYSTGVPFGTLSSKENQQ